jgi:hypothetical protein
MLLAILLLGAALRVYGLADRSLWYDEGSSYLLSQNTWQIGRILNWDYTNEPPLFIVLTHFWYAAFRGLAGFAVGSVASDFALRSLPCVAGIGGIALTYWAGRTILKNESVALLGAFLFAISPFQIYYAQELRAYSLHAALATAALVFLAKALEENRWLQWVALTLCLVAGLYNHFVMVWVIVAFNLYFVAALPWHYRRLKAWIPCNLAVIILSAPALRMAFFVSRVFDRAEQRWFPYPDLRIALITFKDFFMGYSPNRLAYAGMTLAAGGLTLLGVWSLKRRLPALLLLITAAAGPVVISMMYWRHSSFPYYTYRLMIPSAVPLYILVGAGMRALPRRAFTLAALTACTGLTVPALIDYYEGRIHPSVSHRIAVREKIDSREAAHFLAERFVPGDAVAHRCTFTMTPFRYYLAAPNPPQAAVCLTQEGRRGVWSGYPHESAYENVGLLPEYLDEFAATPPRVWFIDSWWEQDETDFESRFQSGWLDAHAFRLLRQPFKGLCVSLYVNDPQLMRGAKRSQVADFGDWTIPYYHVPQTPPASALAHQCRQGFAETMTRLGARLPDAFGAHFDGLPGAVPRPSDAVADRGNAEDLFVLPSESDGAFSFAFTVVNGGRIARRLEGRVFESAAVVDSCSFTRENPESDLWRPALQYDPGPPPGNFSSYGMVAHLGADAPDGEAIHANVLLDAGEYTAYVRCIETPDPVRFDRTEVRFMIAPEKDEMRTESYRLIGATDGGNPTATLGWRWRQVGAFLWEGGPGRLRVTAHNIHQLPTAYFDLDRVILIRGGGDGSSPQTRSFDVEVAPSERKQTEFSSTMGDYPSKRVDVEVFDPVSRETRRIWFHVRAGKDAGNALARDAGME